jgi:hypothetical protein
MAWADHAQDWGLLQRLSFDRASVRTTIRGAGPTIAISIEALAES